MSLLKRRASLVGAGVDLRVGLAAGADANTDITIVGIRPGDALIAVLELQPPIDGGATVTDRTAITSIVAPNIIRIAAATDGGQVLAFWWSG